jgi:hemerythrin superfamily protein
MALKNTAQAVRRRIWPVCFKTTYAEHYLEGAGNKEYEKIKKNLNFLDEKKLFNTIFAMAILMRKPTEAFELPESLELYCTQVLAEFNRTQWGRMFTEVTKLGRDIPEEDMRYTTTLRAIADSFVAQVVKGNNREWDRLRQFVENVKMSWANKECVSWATEDLRDPHEIKEIKDLIEKVSMLPFWARSSMILEKMRVPSRDLINHSLRELGTETQHAKWLEWTSKIDNWGELELEEFESSQASVSSRQEAFDKIVANAPVEAQ